MSLKVPNKMSGSLIIGSHSLAVPSYAVQEGSPETPVSTGHLKCSYCKDEIEILIKFNFKFRFKCKN